MSIAISATTTQISSNEYTEHQNTTIEVPVLDDEKNEPWETVNTTVGSKGISISSELPVTEVVAFNFKV